MIITGFQLRAAKTSLKLDYNRLCDDTGISRVTLGRLVNTVDNFDEVKCSAQDAQILYNYFSTNGLIFPDKHTISKNYIVEQKSTLDNLTKFQFIVARTALNLSQRSLAKHIGLTHGSFNNFESKSNNSYLRSNKIPIKDIITFFEIKNVIFPDNKSVSIKNK